MLCIKCVGCVDCVRIKDRTSIKHDLGSKEVKGFSEFYKLYSKVKEVGEQFKAEVTKENNERKERQEKDRQFQFWWNPESNLILWRLTVGETTIH